MMTNRKSVRRAVSVKGLTWQRIKDHCDATGCSMSGFLEELANQKLDEAGVPIPTQVDAPRRAPPKKSDQDIEKDAGQHFTF